ncbi:VOC family protein [Parasphingorhabdus sp.]
MGKLIMRAKSNLLLCLMMLASACGPADTAPEISPIHLDDIHFIVANEADAVGFFEQKFGAREMAHPGERFDLARFLSVKWQDPTITITRIGPYKDLPPERNARWLEAKLIRPDNAKINPYYGVKWLAFATPSLDDARRKLIAAGAGISETSVNLPMEPEAKAFSIYGPDGAELVIVERKDREYANADFAIDHIQFLTSDVAVTKKFFENVFDGTTTGQTKAGTTMKVADAVITLSEPEAFGYDREKVSPASRSGAIQLGVDHLGFLYEDIQAAVDQAALNGYEPVFKPTRYIYKNKPTVYTFTAFASPDKFNIEMVQVDGRHGPHSYYDQRTETDR